MNSKRPIDEVLEKLGETRQVKENEWQAPCPSHGDGGKDKHLYLSEGEDGRVLMKCFHGCTFREICDALGIEPKDTFPRPVQEGSRSRFHLRDQTGKVVAIHHRDDGGQKKKVWWTQPDGKTGLGGMKGDHLPLWGADAIESVPPGDPIVLVEGEKAACALTSRGIPAVGTVTGAPGTPHLSTLSPLKRNRVILWSDNDEEGVKHMERVGKQLQHLGVDCRWFNWVGAPEKGDAADHPDIKSGNVEGLKEMLYSSPRFVPSHNPQTDGAATAGYALKDYAELRKLRRQNKGITGIPVGVPPWDRALGGHNKATSYVYAARPNVGKSIIAGMVGLTASERNYRGLLFTLEMSAVQYIDRLACYMAGVSYFKNLRGQTTDREDRMVAQAAAALDTLPLLFSEKPNQTVTDIRQQIELHEPDIAIIDYLQYVRPEVPNNNRNVEVGQISRELHGLKKEFNIPIILLAQLSRAVEHRGKNAEPQLSDLRDSGEIEQDADAVIFIHRPDMHDPDVEANEEEIHLLCRKNRMGQLWRTKLHFVKDQNWFTDQINPLLVGAVG